MAYGILYAIKCLGQNLASDFLSSDIMRIITKKIHTQVIMLLDAFINILKKTKVILVIHTKKTIIKTTISGIR